jgi:Ku70/Ku80 beta-barrel domain
MFPRELERLPAPFARHRSDRAVSGPFGIREDLNQRAEPEDLPSDQVFQGGRRYRRGSRRRGYRQGLRGGHRHVRGGDQGELENVALEPTWTIEIDEFIGHTEIDPRYLIRPYYLCPDGKIGHDAFAVIRETIREMGKVAIGRSVHRSFRELSPPSRASNANREIAMRDKMPRKPPMTPGCGRKSRRLRKRRRL